MAEPRYVEVPPRSVAPLGRFIGARRLAELQTRAAATVRSAGSATIWNVSSTQYGGGVAEMLRLLVGYAETLGVDTRWVVLDGDPEFFAITKRVHNRLHGAAGDGGALGPAEAAHYSDVLRANVDALDGRIRRDDVVFLHDPQTAGLASHLLKHGVRVAWRCHVGADRANAFTEEAWSFLKPHLDECHTFVFSHAAFVPAMLAGADVWIISPSIDPDVAEERADAQGARHRRCWPGSASSRVPRSAARPRSWAVPVHSPRRIHWSCRSPAGTA